MTFDLYWKIKLYGFIFSVGALVILLIIEAVKEIIKRNKKK